MYTINAWHMDSDFGGILINVVIDGKEFELGVQLDVDDKYGTYFVGRDCWAFINGRALDDGSAKITEICADETAAYWLFWEIANKVIDEQLNN